MRAVADAGPLHYLILIGAIDILPQLFATVLVPEQVLTELSHTQTPATVRTWIARRPGWLQEMPTPLLDSLSSSKLGDGERATIALALSERADLILMDDRAAVMAALAQGCEVAGTIGLLIGRPAAASLISPPPWRVCG